VVVNVYAQIAADVDGVDVIRSAVGQKGEESRLKSSDGYSATTVVLSAVMSAVVVFLTAGLVVLILRLVRRHQQSKQPGRTPAVNISQVSAPGFETVRSRFSEGEIDDDAEPSTSTAGSSQ